MSIKKDYILYFVILLYFISISAFQLGTGFDAIFVRMSFVILIGLILISEKKIILNGQIKWCILFWGWYFLSMLWAKNANDTLYYINNFIQILSLSICIPIVVKNKENINIILKLLTISIFVTAVVLVIKTPLTAWGTERLGTAIGLGPNDLGMKMGIGAVLSLYFLRNMQDTKHKGIKKITYLIFIVLFSIIAMFSGSKKAIIILVLGIVGYEVIATKGIKLLIKIIALSIILYGGVILVLHNDNLYSILGRRIEKTVLTITGKASTKDIDTSLTERRFYIERAMDLFSKNIVLGYGGNNFVSHMREINYSHIAYSHNNFTELLCTLGIIGFSIYYSMWIFVLYRLIKYYWKYKDKQFLIFIIIIFNILIMDYGNVSYINEFNALLLILAYLSVNKINIKEGNICSIKSGNILKIQN